MIKVTRDMSPKNLKKSIKTFFKPDKSFVDHQRAGRVLIDQEEDAESTTTSQAPLLSRPSSPGHGWPPLGSEVPEDTDELTVVFRLPFREAPEGGEGPTVAVQTFTTSDDDHKCPREEQLMDNTNHLEATLYKLCPKIKRVLIVLRFDEIPQESSEVEQCFQQILFLLQMQLDYGLLPQLAEVTFDDNAEERPRIAELVDKAFRKVFRSEGHAGAVRSDKLQEWKRGPDFKVYTFAVPNSPDDPNPKKTLK
jgi:hypothetical protein